jgi:hypothetical protein
VKRSAFAAQKKPMQSDVGIPLWGFLTFSASLRPLAPISAGGAHRRTENQYCHSKMNVVLNLLLIGTNKYSVSVVRAFLSFDSISFEPNYFVADKLKIS